jgi:membrane protein
VLAGLALLLAVSLTVALTTRGVLDWLVLDVAGTDPHSPGVDGSAARWLLATAGFGLGVAVNTILSIDVLTGLPRLRIPLRRVLPAALLVAVGLEGLKIAE